MSYLQGQTVVFTGRLQMPRAKATSLATSAGATVKSAISGTTNLIVAGADAGGKLAEAKARGITIWTEDYFISALAGAQELWAASEPAPNPTAASSSSALKRKRGATTTTTNTTTTETAAVGVDEQLEQQQDAPPAKRARSARTKASTALKGVSAAAGKDAAMGASGMLEGLEMKPTMALPHVAAQTDANVKPSTRSKAGKNVESETPAGATELKDAAKPKSSTAKSSAGKGATDVSTDCNALSESTQADVKPAKGKGKQPAANKTQKSADVKPEPPSTPLKDNNNNINNGGSGSAAPGSPRRPDRLVPQGSEYTVHHDFNVKLNQTNVGGNNNKFYFIQLLTRNGGYFVWTRWGRVGEDGQNQMQSFGNDEVAAIKLFEKKFREKTQNAWHARDVFVKYDGKYQLVETDEAAEGNDNSVPLGKLTQAQIEKGQAVLARLESAITKGSVRELDALSSEFYSLIPTDFGRRRPEAISTVDGVREKEELLKFYLRMGFEDMKEEPGLTPIDGIMALPVPKTLAAAAAGICDGASVKSSTRKGDELAKSQAGSPVKPMGAEMYAALMLYTSNAIYRQLNQVLRDEKRAAVKRYFNYLRLFLEAMSHLPPQKRTLWRGISVDLSAQYAVGSTITWWGVSSCTSDKSVAENFMRGCGGKCTLLTVETKTAIDISSITFYSNEKESLLAPGTQLFVESLTVVGNISYVHLKEVGRVIG